MGKTSIKPILALPLMLLLAMCSAGVAQTNAPAAAVPNPDELARAVEALPEGDGAAKLRKAVLAWSLADYRALVKAAPESSEAAAAILADVAGALASPAESWAPGKTPPGLFPPLKTPEKNPLFADAVKTANRIADARAEFAKGKAGQPASVSPLVVAGQELLAVLNGLVHPQSPVKGDPRLVEAVMRRFEFICDNLGADPKFAGDAALSPLVTEAYLLLKTAYPALVMPSRKARWEKAIESNAALVLARQGPALLGGRVADLTPSLHAKYVTTLYYAAFVFNRKDYLAAADAGLKLIEDSVRPDGGLPFAGAGQNDAFFAHGAVILEMGRLWQMTASAGAKRIIEKSRNYYPLSIEPPGVAEYSSAVSWRRYWTQSYGAEEAQIVAFATGDLHNLRIARANTFRGTFANAFFYLDPAANAPAPAPDGYVTADRNLEGFRGRFGRFSFSGTGRALASDENRGKATFVGAMLLNGPDVPAPQGTGRNWTLNAAFEDASAEIRLKPGPRDAASHMPLAVRDANAVTTTRDFAALSSRALLASYGRKPGDWEIRQAWIATPQRLVGLVTVESLKDQQALGAAGVLTFVSGRSNWGTRKEFEPKGDGVFKYGGLMARIVEQTFGAVSTEYKDVLDNQTSPDNKAGRIVMADARAAMSEGAAPVSYPRGTIYFYLAEVRPETSAQAEDVRRLPLTGGGGLQGFEFREGKRKYRIVFNPTAADLDFDPNEGGGGKATWTAHFDGEQYRPSWLGAGGREEVSGPAPVPVGRDAGRLRVRAGGHIVMVSAP